MKQTKQTIIVNRKQYKRVIQFVQVAKNKKTYGVIRLQGAYVQVVRVSFATWIAA